MVMTEILLLVYGILVSVYIGWWGYILVAGRFDWAQKWWQAQPCRIRKFLPIIQLPRFAGVLLGIVFLIGSLVSLAMICVLLIRHLLQR